MVRIHIQKMRLIQSYLQKPTKLTPIQKRKLITNLMAISKTMIQLIVQPLEEKKLLYKQKVDIILLLIKMALFIEAYQELQDTPIHSHKKMEHLH